MPWSIPVGNESGRRDPSVRFIEALALDTQPDGAVVEVTVTGILYNGLPVEATDDITIHRAGRR